MNYYNEYDKGAAAWLLELIREGLIPDGKVDTRDVNLVHPQDLKGYTQCHFFSGIGGWSHALRLSGWPDDRPVWTGSCPCQSFSVAGKRKGKDDARHLWPVFFNLIRECRPPVVFGEQVSAAIRYGWIDDLQADMEGAGYAVGYHVLGAHSVGAPHIRQRLYWVAYPSSDRATGHTGEESGTREPCRAKSSGGGADERMDNAASYGGRTTSAHKESLGNIGLPDSTCSEEARFGQLGIDVPWARSRPHFCKDGKYRIVPLEPALFPLAHGFPGRVGLLRGAGNAICPWTAKAFIEAFQDAQKDAATKLQ